ncbi:MAG TPA: BrnA antitoxin family protein [Candidatus Acidoferrales bacterium]|nr:BrnA antitoxin family protein [Candidatus Acidoferrales bacterium]
MKAEYDFSKGKRGALLSTKGKTRITIYLDNDIVDAFRTRAEKKGTGYQTMINDVLKAFIKNRGEPVPITESTLRQVLNEVLQERLFGRKSS